MLVSFIICTKNRAAQLKEALNYVATALEPVKDVEVVLVDNGSTDSTKKAIFDFRDKSCTQVKYVACKIRGSGAARKAGVSAASGEWMVFTDDDCYVEKDFFVNFLNFVRTPLSVGSAGLPIRYGSGSILAYDEKHDPRVAHGPINQVSEIPQSTLIPAGIVQSANMFVHKSVFDKIGNFNEAMGAGTPFPCEDIEFATRASLAGFLGALVPFFTVIHHHRRTIGSPQAVATIESYDYGRGAYYASLLDKGIVQAWELWAAAGNINHPQFQMRLAREFEGAAKYLRAMNARKGSR